jgi:hypothetical protein
MHDGLKYKPDWPQARRAFQKWWNHDGLALFITAPADKPHEKLDRPLPPVDLQQQWLDGEYWCRNAQYGLANTYWGGVAAPIFNTMVGGPGSLGLFLGCEGRPGPDTMWYDPVITDPENHPPLKFDTDNWWWKYHLCIVQKALARNDGRYIVGYPDLIENIDTLAQLRDPQTLLMDLIERPEWVLEKVDEINQAFFECFDAVGEYLRDPWDGNSWAAFGVWAPGKMAKVQCDFSCMISPQMFREFVVPSLTQQCDWLDYSMYHLDGTQAIQHLPALLEIESLDANEWTGQAGIPQGGSPEWYGMYREIKAAGKSVQAICVRPEEVEPLIEAVGPEGLFIMCFGDNEKESKALLRRVGWDGDC